MADEITINIEETVDEVTVLITEYSFDYFNDRRSKAGIETNISSGTTRIYFDGANFSDTDFVVHAYGINSAMNVKTEVIPTNNYVDGFDVYSDYDIDILRYTATKY